MKLLQRILIAPLITIGFMLILSAVGYSSMSTLNRALEEMANTRSDHFRVAAEVKTGVLDTQARVYRLMTWAGTLDGKKIDADSKALVASADAVIAAFNKWAVEPDLVDVEKQQGKQISEMLVKYRKSVFTALDLLAIDVNTGMTGMQNADDNFKQLSLLTDELVKTEERLSKEATERATTAYKRAIMISIVALLAAIAVSIGFSVVLARGIAGRVAQATQVAQRIAEGDLSSPIPASPEQDEVGQLIGALQRMHESLREVIGAIAGNAHELHGSATGMSSAAEAIRRASSQQSDSVSSTAAAVEQLTVSISLVADNANEARGITEKTANIAHSGKEMVDGAAMEIGKIAESVNTTARSIHELQTSSQQIGQIANVIREIADQTNLLALNAAIEAARAGEQGRGFAVVADEVRKLAERTGTSTNEIKAMIEAIQAQTNTAVTHMGQASEQVEIGVKMIQDLQAPLEELQGCSAAAVSSLVALAHATKEQSNASTLIAQNVERIAQRGEENSNAASNSHDLAQGLNGMANALQTLVGRFRR
jgi:methyl-accepting chemotaxis protein